MKITLLLLIMRSTKQNKSNRSKSNSVFFLLLWKINLYITSLLVGNSDLKKKYAPTYTLRKQQRHTKPQKGQQRNSSYKQEEANISKKSRPQILKLNDGRSHKKTLGKLCEASGPILLNCNIHCLYARPECEYKIITSVNKVR